MVFFITQFSLRFHQYILFRQFIYNQPTFSSFNKIFKLCFFLIFTGCSDAASSSGALTLPRSVGHDYDVDTPVPNHITNSLDKRSYVPGYMSEYCRMFKARIICDI